ncbi:Ldh family oxidoreductase [Brevibacterium aurantiacum]|uniref:Ureidoglycolate dehydrogenase n=1 Tax=Brevibacterium aurantiacum TaxID=273384 RepID=A0A1D7VYP2_BREAU|nr:Ldh family oxidoreductase [Brevibacterium aurantiacum]AOP51847.1 Ureidoglycolate dehydrogenase [Brevibacterium aurantiacum]MDN5774656.1 Ldh family oxidoreductase [Brevibacterium aurantiacum]RCS98108.1 Ldh family oxidoreductase [Brevibacterium aurantiacum]
MPASDDSPTVSLPATELERLCTSTILAAGSSEKLARSLAAATVAADRRDKIQVGTAHLFDYLDGLEAGRINGAAVPHSVNRLPAAHLVDADGGIVQLAFDEVFDRFAQSATDLGISILNIMNAFPAGELGYYTMRLARRGLIALAGGNSPALMSLFGSRDTVTGTNPLSFALPHPQGPRMFDQASSATAWVNIRDAADRGESIPEGWSQAPDGTATTNSEAGLAGSLLPFGGVKGSNLALMIELLAAHGGANFSVDAPPIDEGTTTPGTGLFVIAISADAFDPEYTLRVEEHLARLDREFGIDFGRKRNDTVINLPGDLHTALLERAAR